MIIPAQFPVFAFREPDKTSEPRVKGVQRDEILGVVVAWRIAEKGTEAFRDYPSVTGALLAGGTLLPLPDPSVQLRTASTR